MKSAVKEIQRVWKGNEKPWGRRTGLDANVEDNRRGEGRAYGGGRHGIEPSELGRVGAAARVQRWPGLTASVPREKLLSLFG